MRLAHFVSFGLGGADRNALNILSGLKAAGCTSLIFYNQFSIPKVMPGIHNNGYEPLSRQRQFEEVAECIKIEHFSDIYKYGIDILHTHRSGEDKWLIPGFDSVTHPFKIIETNFHGSKTTKADIRVYPNKALCHTKRIVLDYENRIIPNAILPPLSSENLRAELGMENKFVFGRIARPDSDIYCSVNLEAYSRIENENTVFLYVAPHEYAKQDAVRFGIKNMVWLDPQLDSSRISTIYNTFDVLLHSNSAGETFGNTIAEAMMHGKPVVSHTGSHTWPQAHIELFGQYDRFVVRGQDIGEYSSLMKELMLDRQLADTAGNYYKERSLNTYSVKRVASQYAEIYREISNV